MKRECESGNERMIERRRRKRKQGCKHRQPESPECRVQRLEETPAAAAAAATAATAESVPTLNLASLGLDCRSAIISTFFVGRKSREGGSEREKQRQREGKKKERTVNKLSS